MGIWTHRQRAVILLAWVLLGGLALWRMLLGPWPAYLYRLAAAATLYLLVRTWIALRGEVPVWAEYGFLFIDAAIVSVAVRLLGGLSSDFYLAYFFVLAEGAVTLVLMDIGMPRLDGIAATRRLAERVPGVKVIILTIYSDDDRVFRALQAGACGYLLKDASPEEIVRAIRAVRGGEGILHPGLVGRVIREFTRLAEPDHQRAQRFSELTPREHEVLDLLAEGLRNQDIAGRLSIAEKTVKHHISSILSKLQLNHRTEAAVLASRSGLGRRNEAR